LSKGYTVSGTYLTDDSLINVDTIKEKINLIKADLSLEKNVFDIVEKVSPTVIFHLAALTSPQTVLKTQPKL